LQVGIEKLLANKGYLAAFPLHDGEFDPDFNDDVLSDRNLLWQHWSRFGKWYKHQPLDKIRGYFGEKIGNLCSSAYLKLMPVGFYFAWLGFYTTWLVIPAIIGFIVFFYGVGVNEEHQVCFATILST
jgi:hypothetical protein